jgi:hypothetical protein
MSNPFDFGLWLSLRVDAVAASRGRDIPCLPGAEAWGVISRRAPDGARSKWHASLGRPVWLDPFAGPPGICSPELPVDHSSGMGPPDHRAAVIMSLLKITFRLGRWPYISTPIR